MSAVIFALLLVATALGLERYSTAHSLDDVQGRLEVEDHLVEAGEPAVIHLVVRNSGPRWKMFLAAKLHLNKEFLPCAEHTLRRIRQVGATRCGLPPGCARAGGRFLHRPQAGTPGPLCAGTDAGHRRRLSGSCGTVPHRAGLPRAHCSTQGVRSPELEEMLGGFLGELSVNRYLYEDAILTAGYRPLHQR